MEIKYIKPTLYFSEEEKQTCIKMRDFVSDMLQIFSNPEYMALVDYYGSSWDEDTISDIYEFCNRIINENSEEGKEWEIQ